jgi:hypothetical protein
MRFWINTVSRDHVLIGVRGGFTQAGHGKAGGLKRLARGDLIAFYSPRTTYPDGEPLQAFTAIGRVVDDAPYQAEMSPSFHPWRRRVRFSKCREAPIRGLIPHLRFIEDPKRWGFPFRRGLFEVDEEDLVLIARAMKASVAR